MTFVQDTQRKVETVARKIEKANPTAAARLMRLSGAIGRAPGSMPEAWAATNIQQMIDVHTIALQMRAKDNPPLLLRSFDWIRNLLIFLPLALTWYGIANAVSAYSSYITSIQGQPLDVKTQIMQTPFLYLWQQGFGGHLANWLILSNLALVDFFLLTGLIFLTA